MNPYPTMPAPSEQPPVDSASLAELRDLPDGDGGEFLDQLIQLFCEDAPRGLAHLGEALTAANALAVARLAHTVKGTAGYFGAHRFQELCGAMEVAGRTGDLAFVPDLLAAAENEMQRVVAALESELSVSFP